MAFSITYPDRSSILRVKVERGLGRSRVELFAAKEFSEVPKMIKNYLLEVSKKTGRKIPGRVYIRNVQERTIDMGTGPGFIVKMDVEHLRNGSSAQGNTYLLNRLVHSALLRFLGFDSTARSEIYGVEVKKEGDKWKVEFWHPYHDIIELPVIQGAGIMKGRSNTTVLVEKGNIQDVFSVIHKVLTYTHH